MLIVFKPGEQKDKEVTLSIQSLVPWRETIIYYRSTQLYGQIQTILISPLIANTKYLLKFFGDNCIFIFLTMLSLATLVFFFFYLYLENNTTFTSLAEILILPKLAMCSLLEKSFLLLTSKTGGTGFGPCCYGSLHTWTQLFSLQQSRWDEGGLSCGT